MVSLSGPINISYSLSESAPNSETTSSGLTTFPLDLLILCARALTWTCGSEASARPVGLEALLTASDGSMRTAVLLAEEEASSSSSLHQLPLESRLAVYSTSPKIIPWDTSLRKGSSVGTTPRSKRTLCQKRA